MARIPMFAAVTTYKVHLQAARLYLSVPTVSNGRFEWCQRRRVIELPPLVSSGSCLVPARRVGIHTFFPTSAGLRPAPPSCGWSNVGSSKSIRCGQRETEERRSALFDRWILSLWHGVTGSVCSGRKGWSFRAGWWFIEPPKLKKVWLASTNVGRMIV